MKDIFSTNLCWRNCESCPLKELVDRYYENIRAKFGED